MNTNRSCPRCGSENRPERRFCRDCGERLAHHCASCGFFNWLDERFCGGCGLTADPHLLTASALAGAAASGHEDPTRETVDEIGEVLDEVASQLADDSDEDVSLEQTEIDGLFFREPPTASESLGDEPEAFEESEPPEVGEPRSPKKRLGRRGNRRGKTSG